MTGIEPGDTEAPPLSQHNPTHSLMVPAVPESAQLVSDFVARCVLLDLNVHSMREGDYLVATAW